MKYTLDCRIWPWQPEPPASTFGLPLPARLAQETDAPITYHQWKLIYSHPFTSATYT